MASAVTGVLALAVTPRISIRRSSTDPAIEEIVLVVLQHHCYEVRRRGASHGRCAADSDS